MSYRMSLDVRNRISCSDCVFWQASPGICGFDALKWREMKDMYEEYGAAAVAQADEKLGDVVEQADEKLGEVVEQADEAIGEAVESAVEGAKEGFLESIKESISSFFQDLSS